MQEIKRDRATFENVQAIIDDAAEKGLEIVAWRLTEDGLSRLLADAYNGIVIERSTMKVVTVFDPPFMTINEAWVYPVYRHGEDEPEIEAWTRSREHRDVRGAARRPRFTKRT